MARHYCVVFTGPSLSWSEATAIDKRLRCCPPARRGDIAKAAKTGVKIIGLIDGVFYDRAAVSHREIINAMRSGATVIGGASMGALRASELDGFGMIGVGKIYECFKAGVIEADDEVAVAYNPVTFAPVSDPLVNIRAGLQMIEKASIVSKDTREILLALAQSSFYVERSFPSLLKGAEQRRVISGRTRNEIETFLAHRDYDLKRRDAVLTVQKVARFCEQRSV
jgi:hypothetical protein